ncbi:MAG: proline--tRNA ligase [Candidatus Verstraetearchaeota archaeon]|nr:proline--tRNA ligase [Candidatus Verstraetearchaeota archaeon]
MAGPERKVWSENYSEWFHKVISETPIYDTRYPVKGTGIWTPFGFRLRSSVLNIIREELERTGHDEVLFPQLIPDYLLSRESEHIRNFEDEVYWVTHGGKTPLDVKLALRPTSETAMYPIFKLWINAYSDLPLKIFQVVSVFRYETKATRPMIRVREVSTFKEAHTAHATREEAEEQVRTGVEVYSRIFGELKIPFLRSVRPDWDKFPGAERSVAFDTIMPDGKVLQIGTVHFLGQNFSKAFDIKYMTKEGGYEHVWQTCYGISERAIAALISVHGDDRGLVLPSNIAPVQVVVIPIVYKGREEEVLKACVGARDALQSAGIRAALDNRRDLTPGNKYYSWEMKGVPVRVEIGPRDLDAGTAVIVRRDSLKKVQVQIGSLAEAVKEAFREIDLELGRRSRDWMETKVRKASSIDEAKEELDRRGGVVEMFWCGRASCGQELEKAIDARILGTPYEDEIAVGQDAKCILCGEVALKKIRAARSY